MNMFKSAITLLFLLAFSALAVQAADPVSVTVLENGPDRILVNYRFADFTRQTVDIEGEDKPALIAEMLMLYFVQ